MRLGGPLFEKYDSPEKWIACVRAAGYRAAFCPVKDGAGDDEINAYADAAQKADIVIAEVGAWSNPLSPDNATRQAALEKCKNGLLLAEKIGARCCVNIAGSRGEKWDGPCAADLTDETFDMIVASVREIIDAVKPVRAFYTLETMPWMFPDSPDAYLKLFTAIDRKGFAVHFDPVNLICSPQRYFTHGAIIRDFVKKLGKNIKSCHCKDILLQNKLTTHLDEVRPGLGALDYRVFLSEVSRLGDVPAMLEHLPNADEYAAAGKHIRGIAQEKGIEL